MVNFNYVNFAYPSHFTKKNIEETVKHGTYAMIESVSSEDIEISESKQKEKFDLLGQRLADNGFPHQQITGTYEGITTKFSFFVMMSEEVDFKKFRQIIFRLGEEFKQESVIFSSKEVVELVFTTGTNTGKALTGKGFNNKTSRNFSEITTSDQKNYIIGEYNLNRHLFLEWSP